jgi:isoquinoline 1-oxidoreductase beta subunit
VVRLDNAVAVVATASYWRAKQALARLQPEWDVGEAGTVDSEQLSKAFRTALGEPMLTARNDGNFDQGISGAAKTFEAVYETPYLSHSPMEPMNATVHLQPDRLDVWVGTQDAEEALEAAAHHAGLKPEQVYIHNAFLGGGFGRRDAMTRSRRPSPSPRRCSGRSNSSGRARRIPARTSSVRMPWSPSRRASAPMECRRPGRCAL